MIKEKSRSDQLPKCPSGIKGLDEISFGGLPKYRSTLVTGGTGSGKTIMGLQFLMYGAAQKEPGLFVAFEESEEDLIQNSLSLSYDLRNNIKKKLIVLKHIQIDRTEFEESGEYNLEGLFVQIGHVIKQYKIKRVVLDTIEVLFSHLTNEPVIRAELQRLFQWLKKMKVTAIVTAEQGSRMITRYGLEEYVADCVIQLTNVPHECMATRYLRIIKYRGSSHGANEYPFIINSHGISILPITSLTLEYPVPRTFVSSGIKRLDEMLNGTGYYKGSSVLITGTSGVGKSSFVSAFADGICKKGGTCIYFSFEESQDQVIRDMRSIGMRLDKWTRSRKLIFKSVRPSAYGLESHLLLMIQAIDKIKPDAVIIDPISNLKSISNPHNVRLMLSQLMNYLKNKQITTVMTSLLREGTVRSEESISSLIDTWLLLRVVENEGERSIVIGVNKSRGMPHSRQLREVIFSDKGLELTDVYLGTGRILTGSSRIVQSIQDEIKKLENEEEHRMAVMKLKDDENATEAEIRNMKKKLQSLRNQERLLHAELEKTNEIAEKGVLKIRRIRQPASTVRAQKGK